MLSNTSIKAPSRCAGADNRAHSVLQSPAAPAGDSALVQFMMNRSSWGRLTLCSLQFGQNRVKYFTTANLSSLPRPHGLARHSGVTVGKMRGGNRIQLSTEIREELTAPGEEPY